MSYFSQMAGLTVQNFLSAGVGIVRRGRADPRDRRRAAAQPRQLLAGHRAHDPVRAAADLVRRRAGARLPGRHPELLALPDRAHAHRAATQTIAMGPVASQEAIKELGTNGGGFFNVNSAHPFENPTGFTNFVEMLRGADHPGGARVHLRADGRQPPPGLRDLRGDDGDVPRRRRRRLHRRGARLAGPARRRLHTHAIAGSAGGNMEGKEQRFGIAGSALFDVVTTVTSCGAVNSAIESFTGIGGAVPMANLSASEVIFGGVGTGLYSMLAVRPARGVHRRADGRAHARVPRQEDRGARDQARRRSASLITPLAALFSTALGDREHGRPGVDLRRGAARRDSPRRFYAYLSPGQQQRLGVRRLHRLHPAERRQPRLPRRHVRRPARRLHDAVRALRADPVRARRRRRARRQAGQPRRPGHDAHRQPTFVVLLIGVIVLVGALTFFPALLLGPIVQGLTGHLY